VSLLAPLFALGLLGIALPLWLHRLQTHNPKRVAISSAMLLEQSEKRLQVQKRLRFWLLLALRIALLALLALAFAQPLWKLAASNLPFRNAHEHLIMVDVSLSMRADGRFAAARTEAAKIIADMGVGERAQLATAGTTVTLITVGERGASSDKAALLRALSQLEAGESRLDYATAVGAIDTLVGAGTLPVVAHLVSDFQASGMSPRFAELLPRSERGRSIALQLHPVAMQAEPNWSVVDVKQSGADIDVTVRGHGTTTGTQDVTLKVNGALRDQQLRSFAVGGDALVRFNNVALNAGDNRVIARVAASDALSADNQFNSVMQGGGPLAVPLLTADTRAPSATFVAAALAVSAARYRASATRVDHFDARTLERFRWLAVDDIGAIDNQLAAALQTYLETGGALLAACGVRAATLQTLPLGSWKVSGVTVRSADPLSVGRVDGSHAVLANTSGWQNISVARMLKIQTTTNDRVLVATDDGAPLLIERRYGQGRLLLLTTSLDNTWSDLPVQPVFVSFVAEAANWLAGAEAYGSRQLAGATLALAAEGAALGQVIDPDGRELLSLAATRNAPSIRLPRTGFYQVITPARESLVAVNVDERESRLTPIDAATLAGWREAAQATQAVASTGAPAQAERDSLPLARWLLALLTLIVVAESCAGNWLLRRNTRALT
jgi:Aerotolerance regulator N-terminal